MKYERRPRESDFCWSFQISQSSNKNEDSLTFCTLPSSSLANCKVMLQVAFGLWKTIEYMRMAHMSNNPYAASDAAAKRFKVANYPVIPHEVSFHGPLYSQVLPRYRLSHHIDGLRSHS